MAVGDIYEVALVGAQSGSTVVATLNYETTVTTGTKSDEMQALAEAVLVTLVPSIAALQSDQLTYNVIRVRDVADETLGFDRIVSGAGARAAEAMPKQIAALILWKSAFIGRSKTGRLYLGALTEDVWDGEAWVSAFLTSVTAFVDEIATLAIVDFPVDPSGYEWKQVIYSELLVSAVDRISWGISPNPATQRRRKSGVGI